MPCCGDHTEAHAWSVLEVEKHQRHLAKRKRRETTERHHLENLLTAQAEAKSTHHELRQTARRVSLLLVGGNVRTAAGSLSADGLPPSFP